MRWDDLAEPWQCCLEEAWTAYCAGSIPIGAAITDQEGRIVARGRNRVFERTVEPPLLCGHRLAHAEMNALVAFPWDEVDPRTSVLYTTTEPCALCTGAIRMTHIGEVRYAARDGAAGSIALLEATSFMRRGGVRVVGPENAELETLIAALHVEFVLRTLGAEHATTGRLLADWQPIVPAAIELGLALVRSSQLQRLRDARASAAEVVAALARTLD